MTKIVYANRRFSNWSRGNRPEAWTSLVQYEGRNIVPTIEIPAWLSQRWSAQKSELGYASFRGFSPAEALQVVALAKGRSAHLCINRWGQVNGYKLLRVKQEKGTWKPKSQ